MKYDLSIIVPIYNVEKYLEQAIESLLNQREYSYEIVLVNDGSTDTCRSICERYAGEYGDKIQLLNKENGGLPSARKAGVRIARGEYITFLDGDDWIDEDYYYNMIVHAKECNAEVACSSHCISYPDREKEDKNAIKTGVYENEELEKVKENIFYQKPYYTYGIYPSLCMKVILKSYLEQYLYEVPDNITIAEDAACSYPILLSCTRLVALSDNTGYHYRQTHSSMMHVYNPNKISKVINVMNYLDEEFKPYYSRYKLQIDMYYTQLIKELAKNELLSDKTVKEKKETLNVLLQEEYTVRALADLKKFPFLYRIFFWMLREQKVTALNMLYTIYKRLICNIKEK